MLERKRSGPQESVRGRVGVGTSSGHQDFSGERWWGWSTSSRSCCIHGSGDEHFLLKANLPAQERAVPLSPQLALLTEGPMFSGEWGRAGVGQCLGTGAEHTADATSDLSVVLAPSPGRLLQSAPPSEPLTARLDDGQAIHFSRSKSTSNVFFFFSLRGCRQPWPQLMSPLRHTSPMRLAHARRRASWESPGPCAPPPSLAKPEQMSADREARTEQGC